MVLPISHTHTQTGSSSPCRSNRVTRLPPDSMTWWWLEEVEQLALDWTSCLPLFICWIDWSIIHPFLFVFITTEQRPFFVSLVFSLISNLTEVSVPLGFPQVSLGFVSGSSRVPSGFCGFPSGFVRVPLCFPQVSVGFSRVPLGFLSLSSRVLLGCHSGFSWVPLGFLSGFFPQ